MATYENQPGFNPGGIKDRIDTRDFKWSEVGHASAPFDWNVGYDIEVELGQKMNLPTLFKIPVKDQGPSGSCGGQAWAYQAQALEAIQTGTFEERSAKYVYSQTWVPGGGSRGRDNATIFAKQGVSRETALTSYENGNAPSEAFMERSQDITAGARQDAMLAIAASYVQLENNGVITIDSVAQAMRDNHGVILGVDGQNNGTWNSQFPQPPTATEWRHFTWSGKAKLIGGVKHIGFLNSWGTATGDQGWQWYSEAYFNTTMSDGPAIWTGWTHVINPNAPNPSFHHNFVVQLHLGDKNSEVVALQQALQIDGEFPASLPATGLYGDITRRAVLAFQIKYKVAPPSELIALNGKVVGPATLAQLNRLFNK